MLPLSQVSAAGGCITPLHPARQGMPSGPLACPPTPLQPYGLCGGHWPRAVATVPSPGPASRLSPAPPLPGGVLPDLRHDHRRVRPPGPVEEERAEEAGPAVLNAVHYKYIHTYKYIHRKISILQLCMILGAVCGRGALCTPESELESCRSSYALCFLFFSNPDSVSVLGFSQGLKRRGPQSTWCLSVLPYGVGGFSCCSHSTQGWGRAGPWDGGVGHPHGCPIPFCSAGLCIYLWVRKGPGYNCRKAGSPHGLLNALPAFNKATHFGAPSASPSGSEIQSLEQGTRRKSGGDPTRSRVHPHGSRCKPEPGVS